MGDETIDAEWLNQATAGGKLKTQSDACADFSRPYWLEIEFQVSWPIH